MMETIRQRLLDAEIAYRVSLAVDRMLYRQLQDNEIERNKLAAQIEELRNRLANNDLPEQIESA